MDKLSPSARSALMGRVKSKDTRPEIRVRSYLHRKGFRFRLHQKHLPGCPDLTFPKYRTVVFVHGCFWHRHKGCKKAGLPKTRRQFWKKKLTLNAERDRRNQEALRAAGWKVLTAWECTLAHQDLEHLARSIGVLASPGRARLFP
jgi:DNA mismatch endonuclease (patch repair protein)